MRSRGEIYIAGFLTCLSGFVDAIGFLALVQIYTANMSGNSVALGVQLWNRNWPEAARRACPIFIYVIGLMYGRIWLEIAGRLHIRSAAAFAFSIEMIVLVPAAFSHSLHHHQAYSPAAFIAIALLAFAMGLQNATLTHFSSLTLHTGFVTGTLVKMTEHLTKYFTWAYEQLCTGHEHLTSLWRRSRDQENFQKGVLLGGIWGAYVIGGVLGAAAEHFYNMRSLLVAIAALATLALLDLRRPIARADEEEQEKIP